MGIFGAACFRTLSDKEREIPKAQWDLDRMGMICTSSGTFAEWKKSILKLCEVSKLCTFEIKQEIISFNEKIEKITQRVKKQGEK